MSSILMGGCISNLFFKALQKYMDLRIIKTENSIREAYFNAKRNKPLNKIKVTDICRMALINKSTFYKHYQDIYALAEAVENDFVNQIMGKCEYASYLFSDTNSFISEIVKVLFENKKRIKTVFDSRYDALVTKIEKYLLNLYLKDCSTQRESTLIKFCIGGAFYVFINHYSSKDTIFMKELIVEIIEKVGV